MKSIVSSFLKSFELLKINEVPKFSGRRLSNIFFLNPNVQLGPSYWVLLFACSVVVAESLDCSSYIFSN